MTCVICIEPIISEQTTTRLPCAHTFHTDCIETALQHTTSCPICRHDPVAEERRRLKLLAKTPDMRRLVLTKAKFDCQKRTVILELHEIAIQHKGVFDAIIALQKRKRQIKARLEWCALRARKLRMAAVN